MELRDNTYILIKEANNRGSVGIMITKHYKMVYDRLNDNQLYKKTDTTCDNKVINKIKKLPQKYQNIITQPEID